MNVWHPLLAAVEVEVGVWHLNSQRGPYAVVRLLTIGGERGYRVTTYREPRQLVGYFTTLRAACEAGHRAHVRSHGPQLEAANLYPDLSGSSRGSAQR